MNPEDVREIRRLFLAALLRNEQFSAAAAEELGLAKLAAAIRAGLPVLREQLEECGQARPEA